MLPTSLWLLCLATIGARAADTTDYVSVSSTYSTVSSIPTSDFTGSQYTYVTETSQSTVQSISAVTGENNATTTSTGSDSQKTVSTSHSQTVLAGTNTQNATNATASATSSAVLPSNTVACNNYPEFCDRKYSNITEVCAHNSAFDVKNNAASNQELPILDQLNDGVRMLQGETHWVNDTVYNCHTDCDLLNVGPWQDELEVLVSWVEKHPYDVVTFLIVNSDYVKVEDYVSAIENSGILPYLYLPAYVPQHRDQWPTLAEMILTGKRVVMFMDYNANQTAIPYILDEFTHMFETPFSPTNQSFPCTLQRPPGLNTTLAEENYMYLANHNLNVGVDLGALTGSSDIILLADTAELNITNGADDQYGELQAMAGNCTLDWGRPPNFLLVDYYNIGIPAAGSVFEVAARMNGVTYNRKCCGDDDTSAAPALRTSFVALVVALVFVIVMAW